MVKKLVSISIVAGAGILGACFGDGPKPSAPAKATILVSGIPVENCNTGSYIGPVAIGSSGSGFVTMLPYNQDGGPNNCGGGGNNVPTTPIEVFAFDRDNGTQTDVGPAGQAQNGFHDRLTVTPSGVAWAYDDTGMMGTSAVVNPGHVPVGSGGMGFDAPLGIVSVDSDIWVELAQSSSSSGRVEPDNPEYPCCGPVNGQPTGSIWHVGPAATSQFVTAVNPMCDTATRCFVADPPESPSDPIKLAYFESQNMTGGNSWQVSVLTLATPMMPSGGPHVLPSPSGGGEVPVGLAAFQNTIAWTTSLACENTPCSVSDCNVYTYDLTTTNTAPNTLLSTHRFGCMDARIADGYVYFAIVAYDSNTEHMHGIGIGRVSIADHTFESLDLGIQGDAAGPRRVLPSGDRLYLVDPLVMARIEAAELSGKHDFAL
jgi:hypothetical protein